MYVTLIYPHDEIFNAVKQESSLHAIRQTDKEGNPLFESLVLDEAYLPKFRELFYNARGQAVSVLSAYLKGCDNVFERADFSENRDFICHLDMPRNFNEQMAKPIEDWIFSLLKDWIMYKWLETKLPDTAATFRANCEEYKVKITGGLNSRERPICRYHGYY